MKYETVVITEVTDEAHVYAQHVDEGPKLVGLMKQLREEFSQNPPLAGAFQPKRGTHIHLSMFFITRFKFMSSVRTFA